MKILRRAETKLSRIKGRRSRIEGRAVASKAIFDLRSSILNPRSSRLITGLGLLFLHELIGREFRIDLDLADLPLFVQRTVFNFGHAVREVEAAGALKLAESPAVIDFKGFLESLLSFFHDAFALFGSEFSALSRLSTLSRLSALSRLSCLRALGRLSTLSRLSWLRALGRLSALASARPVLASARPARTSGSSRPSWSASAKSSPH